MEEATKYSYKNVLNNLYEELFYNEKNEAPDFYEEYERLTRRHQILTLINDTLINQLDHVLSKRDILKGMLYGFWQVFITNNYIFNYYEMDISQRIIAGTHKMIQEIQTLKVEIENIKEENRALKEIVLQLDFMINGDNFVDVNAPIASAAVNAPIEVNQNNIEIGNVVQVAGSPVAPAQMQSTSATSTQQPTMGKFLNLLSKK